MKRVPGFQAFLAWLALAAAGPGQPVFLPEFRVDAYADPLVERHAEGVALSEDGSFVVTWLSGGEVLARRFNAQANPLGGLPLGSSAVHAYGSSIARDASGRSVVVWTDGNFTIRGRRFDGDGSALGDSFLVTASSLVTVHDPRVASDPTGNFVVAWDSQGGEGSKIVARRFDSHGSALGYEFVANAFTPGSRSVSGIGMSAAGFVVSWNGDGPSGPGVFGRRFDATGAPLTGDLPVNTANAVPGDSDVAMAAAGDFVVVWNEGPAVLARRFDSAGAPRGDALPIGASAGAYNGPHVASDSFGNFLVVWNNFATTATIAGRSFDFNGDPAGPEFQVAEGWDYPPSLPYDPRAALADDGSFVVAWTRGIDYGSVDGYQIGARKSGLRALGVYVAPRPPTVSDNGVLEPGESAGVGTAWTNDTADSVALTGVASAFSGPPGATYTLDDATADYGTVPASTAVNCLATANCYRVSVSAPAARPAPHWDAQLQEALNTGVPKTWTLHVGESFSDVPVDSPFYAFIETLLHTGVTGGCATGGYCPEASVSRAQMAVFLLKAKFGGEHVPPPCTGTVFADVPCAGGTFDSWIEELAALQITDGCGSGLYCPNDSVTREQMAVFLLKAREGSAYNPPDCAGLFADVTCTPGSGFADWIEELARRGVTGGCSPSPLLYCPTRAGTRGQMAAFLTKTFGLVLYGGNR